jgi:hypothetical protein
MTIANSVGVVPTGLSAFWPVFMYLLLSPPAIRSVIWILVGSICLSLTHETALFGFLAMAAYSFYRGGRYHSSLGGIFLCFALWLAYRAYAGFVFAVQFRDAMLTNPWGPYTWASLVGIGALVATLVTGREVLARWGVFAMLLCFGAICFAHPDYFASLYAPFNSRAPSFPAAAVVALAGGWAFSRRWWALEEGRRLRSSLAHLAVFTLMLGTVNELAMTLKWRSSLNVVKEELASTKVCGLVSPESRDRILHGGTQPYHLAELSLLLQGTRYPAKILGDRSVMENEVRTDLCRDVAAGAFWRADPGGFRESYQLRDGPHMNFGRLRTAAASIHTQL